MIYKNLSRNAKKLYKIAYGYNLTEWHFNASRILENINGMQNAEEFLKKCSKHKKIYE